MVKHISNELYQVILNLKNSCHMVEAAISFWQSHFIWFFLFIQVKILIDIKKSIFQGQFEQEDSINC